MKCLIVLVCALTLGDAGTLRCSGHDDANCQLTEDINYERPIAQATENADTKETDATEAECLPGTEWESNCHFCRCAEGGVAQCIRQAECGSIFGEPLKCKPNTTFTRDCNTCICLENGLGLCTLESCQRSSIAKKSELQSGKECAPGSKWASSCNQCWCSPSGFRICTLRICTSDEEARELFCAPDTMWNNNCNTCWCTAEGRAMCTKMGCVTDAQINESSQVENSAVKASLEPDYEIEMNPEDYINDPVAEDLEELFYLEDQTPNLLKNPNDLESADINIEDHDSNLLEDGHNVVKVTENETHNVLKRSVCKPNQIFQSECNLCNCAADGHSFTCSHNECMEDEMNKEVEVFKENEGADHVERHSVCKARATFYIGCNTCHCNYYGTDYSCTNKPCPLPEDVELFHELKEMKPILPYEDGPKRVALASQKPKRSTKV